MTLFVSQKRLRQVSLIQEGNVREIGAIEQEGGKALALKAGFNI